MKKRKTLLKGLAALLGAAMLTGCGSTQQASADTQAENSTTEVRKITIGFNQTGVPYGYIDENGKATGYDIEALRLVDELLPEYEFEFVGTESKDAWAAAKEGKYQIAATNAFYSEERAENYIIPEENIGATVLGLTVRKEDADVDTLDKAAERGFTATPTKGGAGPYIVLQEYNEQHPDKQIPVEAVDEIDASTAFNYIVEGRYDCQLGIYFTFDQLVAREDGKLHDQYADKLVTSKITAVRTYPLINKNETELAQKVNDAIKQLKEEGKLSELAVQFYGYDVFEYLDEDNSSDSAEAEAAEVRTIKVAYNQTGVPHEYVDDDGNAAGYDVDALRLVDELLPEYEFEYIPTSTTDAWTGALEGKYQLAITNSSYSKEREENYIIIDNCLGASFGGIVLRKENQDVDTIEKAVEQGLTFAPTKAGGGFHNVLLKYNETHPDKQIEILLSDEITAAEGYKYVAEGRYDVYGHASTAAQFDNLVVAEDGELHDLYADKLVCNKFTAIKTYPLINKEETELADRINEALGTLYEEGKLSELSIEYYGKDPFDYLEEEER